VFKLLEVGSYLEEESAKIEHVAVEDCSTRNGWNDVWAKHIFETENNRCRG